MPWQDGLEGEYVDDATSGQKYFEPGIQDPSLSHSRGAYEERQGPSGRLVSGTCAGCLGRVEEGDPFVIRYHLVERGGIFHERCGPTGAGWFGVGGAGE